jgi:tRNA (cytidine/uridine-2'-O-)-methyltransferase
LKKEAVFIFVLFRSVFGRETYGLPDELIEKYKEYSYKIPTNNVRSLNLATSVGIVLFEALRQNDFSF